jgi:predicted HicB family RNase H-like nuclease
LLVGDSDGADEAGSRLFPIKDQEAAMTDAASSRSRISKKRKPASSTPVTAPNSRSATRAKPLPAQKLAEARRVAVDLYRKRPDWIAFHRALFGVDGEIVRLFSTAAEREAFTQSQEYAQIEAMEEDLRRQRIPSEADPEPTRIITVRLPRSIHEALREEASSRKISINKLCIAKLIKELELGRKEE